MRQGETDSKQVASELDRRVAERTRQLTEANAELQLQVGLLQHLPVSAWTLKPDGTPDFVNQVWLEYSGQTLDFVRSHPEAWMTAVRPEDRETTASAFWEGVRSGQGFSIETRSLRTQDGTYRWHLNQAVALRDAEGRVLKFVGTTTDIDDQKRAQEELRASENDLRKILDHIPALVCTVSSAGQVVLPNQRLLDYFGKTLEEVNSWPTNDVVHPDDRSRAVADVMHSMTTGIPYEGEVRYHHADGSYRWHHVHIVPARDTDGKITIWYGHIVDIEDRKRAEDALNELRSELAHMARLTTLGALTASIAHEVNQPLSGIVTNASVCLRTLSADPPKIDGAREAAQRMIRDAKRASEVIARLRALFSKKESAAEPVDLNEAAREVIALCLEEIQRNRVILRQELANDLPRVTGDRVQLQQVILNLLRNASDAMSGVEDRPMELVIRTEKDQSDCVRLTVQDTGVGITPQGMERLFEAFYTTKSDGMGMGLSVSRSIIEHHRGRLWATPNDGPGVTFSFSIPSKIDDVAKIQTPA